MTQFNSTLPDPCAPQESETKKALTREETLALREAYVRGGTRPGMSPMGWAILRGRAERAYPLPKITVPRVLVGVADRPEYNYRIIDGKVQVCTNNSILNAGWTSTIFSAEDFKKFGDLAANPTCEVDA